ncbi:MAG: hypothetical protein GF399_07020 [Candidatus Coatesbacteria bacterium]|nr:hypothetical protein [Candidatus Coatesbacteria bacterium]
MAWLWIILAVSGLLLIIYLALRLLGGRLRRLRDDTRNTVLAELTDEDVLHLEPTANCFGLRSRGPAQNRGNGCWALTRMRIRFEPWVGRTSLDIPLERITAVRLSYGFLGKTRGRPLLVVSFSTPGGDDEAAWLTTDLDAALQRLKELLPAEVTAGIPGD